MKIREKRVTQQVSSEKQPARREQMAPQPPKIPRLLLCLFRGRTEHESLIGDYDEIYSMHCAESDQFRARAWYWLQVLQAIPSFLKHSMYWRIVMIKNYFKITFRNLVRYKVFSAINIIGLALSIAICLMIIIYIKDQKDSDQFHEKKSRIVRIYTTDTDIRYAEVKGWATTPAPLAPYLLDNYPFVEEAVRVRRLWGSVLTTGTAISLHGLYAEPSFFDIFSFQLIAGDANSALDKPYSMVISEKTAAKFFGVDDPVNKTLELEDLGEFTVTGVLKELPYKSHFVFDAVASFATVSALINKGLLQEDLNSWHPISRNYTYVLLKNEGDRSQLQHSLPDIARAIFPENERERYDFGVQQLTRINLGLNLANSMPGTKHSFEILFIPFLAVVIIFLACFNYIILSIARSLKRTKEIGLRKVIGAKRSQVIKLFLSETFVITFISLIVACLFLLWLIPAFNRIDAVEIARQQINIGQMKNPGLYAIFILFALVVSLLAGLYPALYLSSFQPVTALQGVSKIKGLSHLLIRKILMGIQFAVSLIAILFVAYFSQLHRYWMTFDRNITMENIVNVALQDVSYQLVRSEVRSHSAVSRVSFSNEVPMYGGGWREPLKSENKQDSGFVNIYYTDPEFIGNFNISLLAGRTFSDEFPTDKDEAIILNQAALGIFGLGAPSEAIDRSLFRDKNTRVTIIGVVQDFNYTFPDVPIEPLALLYNPELFRYANIAYAEGSRESVEAFLPGMWQKLDKVHPVRYEFCEDARQEAEAAVGDPVRISAWGCGFVLLIALMGLLGMATYTTELRVKEIGIRKALGASVPGVAFLLSRGYVKLILYSAVVALPAGYFLSEMMMNFFAFRPRLSLLIPPAALFFVLGLALLTVGSQTVKAALANPVETLKEE